jgi:hypothetical protein
VLKHKASKRKQALKRLFIARRLDEATETTGKVFTNEKKEDCDHRNLSFPKLCDCQPNREANQNLKLTNKEALLIR